MKWQKIGKIFDPREHQLPDRCVDFSQSPQTVVHDKFIRIYFSTRQREPHSGLYLSYISYVDYSKDLKTIINLADKSVIALGALGTFDEHGIFPINPLKIDENNIVAYTCGWNRRVSVPVETSIGLVYSEDQGKTFYRKFDGPILGATPYEPFLVGDPFVRIYQGVYYMWYIFGKAWMPATAGEPVARIYKIAQATSADGINWQKDDGNQIIDDELNINECQALPTVIKINSKYHMYFCYREAVDFRNNPLRGYRLGYAYSSDLKSWTRNDCAAGIDTTSGDWDADMMCYPHLFESDNQAYMLYNGNEFGKWGFGLAILEND